MHRTRFVALALLGLLACSACEPKEAPASAKLSFTDVDPLLKARDLEPAQQKLEALLAKHGPDPLIVARLSRVYRAEGDPSKAVEMLKQSLATHPGSGVVWAELGDIYSELNMLPQCRDAYLKARAGGIADKEIALQLGSCLGRMGDSEGAAAEFERAHKAGVQESVVFYNQALANYEKQDWIKARQLLEQALAKDPKYADAMRELARVLLRGDPTNPTSVDRAMNLLWDAKDSLAEDWHLYEVMGDGWLIQGDWDAALDAYTNALRYGHNPKQVEDKYREAKTRQNAAKKAKADAPPATPK